MAARLHRLPLRLKLTAAFAAAMIVALAAVTGVVFLRFESELNRTIDADLRSRAQALAALVAQQGIGAFERPAAAGVLHPQEAVAQALDARTGRILAASTSVAQARLLTPAQVRAAARHVVFVTRLHLPGVGKRTRFAAAPVRPGRRTIVVVGRSLKDREGANESFARALLIGGPLALLLASALGYALASAALRPVESMRARAATISSLDPAARLPVPEGDDELTRLGRTLNDMLARIERSFERQRALTANASHQLRTPLAVLVSTLEVALRRERSRDELEATLREALAEAERLARLADQLLVLAQAEEDDAALRRERLDVDRLAEEVAGRYARQAEAAGRTVTVLPSGASVQADRVRLEQAISNLVDNALVHGAGAVTVAAAQRDGMLELHVRDEGPGLSAEFAGRAFDRFSRGEESRLRPGAGLGLSIVEAVAQAHGGRVGAAPGPPSDVWIAIPRG